MARDHLARQRQRRDAARQIAGVAYVAGARLERHRAPQLGVPYPIWSAGALRAWRAASRARMPCTCTTAFIMPNLFAFLAARWRGGLY